MVTAIQKTTVSFIGNGHCFMQKIKLSMATRFVNCFNYVIAGI